MCGIVGLFAKSSGDRGAPRRASRGDARPDERSRAGQRRRRRLPRPGAAGSCKLSSTRPIRSGLGGCCARFAASFGGAPERRCAPATLSSSSPPTPSEAEEWVRDNSPDLRVMSAGLVIEIYKEVGRPSRSPGSSQLADLQGRTRSATRAWRPRAGSPPRAPTRSPPASTSASSTTGRSRTTTGCAENLRREGIEFQTENDTEVAAGYLAWRLREGATLEQALEGCLDDLDGFYTFPVGTADGFAVLRDPIACKPAVLAETDDWVAMASEYHAIAVLPGAAMRACGSPSQASSTCGRRHAPDGDGARDGSRRPRRDAPAGAEPAPARCRAHRLGPAALAYRQPERRPCGRLRSRRGARGRDRRACRATTAPA